MRLIKITLSGFKSFVDSTMIAFPGNLTAIVGPNGCGKSNIIDAVRWVLGEGSAKTLRGDSMADVIFNGSSVRKPVGRASVELLFNNADGALGGAYSGYAEIAVRRVVSRDGTSKYFLNNSRCRRKDITHMLLGTGLGSHGYSIIEQGMISRLVEAKPEELRAFLEEAAGISKYKERRRETENRIRRTRDNLNRLTDLLEEVAKGIGLLQRQAKAAERFKSLKAEQRRMRAELLALRLAELRDDHDARRALGDERQTHLERALARQRATEARIETLRLELDECNSAHGKVGGRALELNSEISRLEQSLEHRKRLESRRKRDLEELSGQLAQSRTHSESDHESIRRVERLLTELEPELASARGAHRVSLDDLRQAEADWEASQEEWGRIVEMLAGAERTERIEDERVRLLDDRCKRLQDEREQLKEERSGSRAARIRERLDALAEDEQASKRAYEGATATLQGAWEQLQGLRETEADIARRLDEAGRTLHEQQGRLASLVALQEAAAEPASSEVGEWLRSGDWHSNPRYADGLEVEAGWETAVETVLGDYLQAVCMDRIDDVAESLSGLTTGQLTLWEGGIGDDPAGGGSRRLLGHFVKGPGVDQLLKGVFWAESVTDALAIRGRLKPHESVVTRDGLWMGPQWIRIRRGADPQAGVMARAAQIKQLRADVERHAELKEGLRSALGETRKELEHLEDGRSRAQAEAAEFQQKWMNVSGELEAGRLRLEELIQRNRAAQRRMEEIDEELKSLGVQRAESAAELGRAKERREKLAVTRAELEARRAEHRRRLEEARAVEERGRSAAQSLSFQIESGKQTREAALGALDRVRDQQVQLRRRRDELESEIKASVEPVAEDKRLLEERLKEKLRVEDELRAARSAVEDVESRLTESKFGHAEQEREVDTARQAVEEARLGLREVEVRMESMRTEIARTGFETDHLQESLPDDASVSSWESGLDKLERRIRLMGSVNLAAIDELEKQLARKRYMDDQFEDLSKSLATLEGAIRKIDRETRTRFDETFKAANAGLARLFPRLYGGGHAYLELEGDDLLTSGVTIMARPPGKRVSTIHLLSGGEKALTAVALVFSIFELNPAPFCLLDEVDAPLDDANVGRFAEIVNEMSQQVQFVLITHNKATMESMRQLVGVTMSEPGVSRLVAVDIDEAVQLAAV